MTAPATAPPAAPDEAVPPGRPRWWRPAALTAYAAALVTWVVTVGLPTDPFLVFGWLWAATVAWYVGQPWRRQLDFVRDWWPAFAVLVVYMYSRGLSDELIGMPVSYTMPVRVDEWLTGGTLPTAYLQDALCGDPCLRSSDPRWYDVVLTTVYYTHFVASLTLALVLWVRDRAAWVVWLTRYLAMNVAGLVVYVLYPMAPPWLAAQDGYLAEEVVRLTGRGWRDLGLGGFHTALAAVGNPVAAMPSLHGGIAMLIALYAVTRLRGRWWRGLVLAYPVVMGFALVYYAEHYVVDIAAGWALAVVVTGACVVWERRRAGRQVAARPDGAGPGVRRG
ncbi:phosphatase PAP2 family protein [Nocardioides sp. ChNu-153]|uniref:phosphatase PAP2 family protein n=1 Tax=Nocardioides sp. ChNu-153 TaxID=2779364 RepID=UPI00264AADBA|nr:phosphatase PAP2 family protein [Nocardioides sp. ChNu-153]MDN7120754.1 phosphatase PAP2 family protein [Nocardioides sp. ChNu-153]